METIKKFLSGWFGYDRRERRATVAVLIVLLITGFGRYTVRRPHPSPSVMEIQYLQQGSSEGNVSSANLPEKRSIEMANIVPQTAINLNLCDSADLERLPGIGPVLSARIIKYRNLLGGYADVRQLKEVYGLKEEVFEMIRERVSADTTHLKMISVNSDSWSALLRHPYLEPEHVKSIVQYREQKGRITSWEIMVTNQMVPLGKEEFLIHYILY